MKHACKNTSIPALMQKGVLFHTTNVTAGSRIGAPPSAPGEY